MKFTAPSWHLSGRAILDLLIEASYLAVIFIIPLWFAYWFPTYNIFEFNKIIIFKILVYLLFLATGLKIIFYPPSLSVRPKQFFKKYWLVPTIFIIGLSLTLFSSSNPTVSFYGTIERQGGLVSYLLYFLWFILVSFNLLTIDNRSSIVHKPATSAEKNISGPVRRIVMTAALSGTLVAIYGILQFLNIDFLAWPEPAFLTHRAFSSLGQPNFLASWLLLVIPPSIYLLVTSRRPLIRFAWSLALASQVIALFLSGSRGGVIALLGVVALFLIYRLALSSWPRRYKYLTVLSFIILALATLWLLNYSSQGRVQELAETDSGSLAVRINLYEAAASAISTHPWLGYGLETGSEVFIKYYTPDWGVYGDVGQSADRAHNLPLDILLVTGAWGLLLFCGLYYFGFNLVRDNLRHNHWAGLTLALAGGLSGYLLSLLFSFSLVSGEIYSWLFLAVLVAINFSGRYPSAVLPAAIPSAVRLRPRKIWLLSWLGLVLVLVTFWQISRTFQDLIVDYYFDQTYKTSGDSDYAYIFQLANYLSLAPAANPINRSSYNYYLADKLNAVYANLTDPALSKLVRTELQILDQNIPANGYQNLTLKARINTLLHNFSLAQQYLTQVLRLAPNWPPAYITQGELAAAAGDKKGALLAYYSASLNLPDPNDPRLNEPHGQVVRGYQYLLDYKIAEIYQQQSDYALAGKYYSLAYQSYPTNFSLLKKIADTYYQRGDLAMAISYNQHGLERNPNDYNWPLALAILYRESGNNSQARNYLQRAIRLAPHNQQLQKLQLEYGH